MTSYAQPFRGSLMGSRIRALIERLLPWYSPDEARRHDGVTQAIAQESGEIRARAQRLRDLADPERLASYGRVSVRR